MDQFNVRKVKFAVTQVVVFVPTPGRFASPSPVLMQVQMDLNAVMAFAILTRSVARVALVIPHSVKAPPWVVPIQTVTP